MTTTSFRLTASYSLILAISLFLLSVFFYWSTIGLLVRDNDAVLNSEIQDLANQYQKFGLERLAQVINSRIKLKKDPKMVYLLALPSGRAVVGNLIKWPISKVDRQGKVEFILSSSDKDKNVRARVFNLNSGVKLLVGRQIEQIQKLRDVFFKAIVVVIIVTIFVIFSGLIVSKRILGRIKAVTAVTSAINSGDLSVRLEETLKSDEFNVLARHLNTMLDRLENLVVGVKNVSDNIAHDLRTPLTRLRNKIEMAAKKAPQSLSSELEACTEEADKLLAIFSSLLRISRIESGSYAAKFKSVDLKLIILDAIELYNASADVKNVVLVSEIDDEIMINGERNLLFQLVVNLLDNAIKYAPEGSSVRLRAFLEYGKVIFIISDSGCGVPKDSYDEMIERFVRLDSSRTKQGSGLGLSLVNAVAKLHKAKLSFADNSPGLRVTIEFLTDTI